jgi:Flp pilus assembly protein CpaB
VRARRTAYIVIFVVACLVAGLLYYLQVPRASVVRATADIPAMTQITADMVETVKVAPVDVSTDAAQSTSQVVGQYAAMPILAGQEIDKRALDRTPGQQQFGFGAALDPGDVAFAIPISDPSQAVGGALSPGAKVTVVAVPNALKNGVAASPAPTSTVLGTNLTILALRTPNGQTFTQTQSGSGIAAVPPKLGSVVVAIPAGQLSDFATAALSSTFYLALSVPGGAASTS